jgi:hypothetical protein
LTTIIFILLRGAGEVTVVMNGVVNNELLVTVELDNVLEAVAVTAGVDVIERTALVRDASVISIVVATVMFVYQTVDCMESVRRLLCLLVNWVDEILRLVDPVISPSVEYMGVLGPNPTVVVIRAEVKLFVTPVFIIVPLTGDPGVDDIFTVHIVTVGIEPLVDRPDPVYSVPIVGSRAAVVIVIVDDPKPPIRLSDVNLSVVVDDVDEPIVFIVDDSFPLIGPAILELLMTAVVDVILPVNWLSLAIEDRLESGKTVVDEPDESGSWFVEEPLESGNAVVVDDSDVKDGVISVVASVRLDAESIEVTVVDPVVSLRVSVVMRLRVVSVDNPGTFVWVSVKIVWSVVSRNIVVVL